MSTSTTSSSTRRRTRRRTLLALGLAALFGAPACAPITVGAHAIQPPNAVDTPNVWVYLQTTDPDRNGIYRCFDRNGVPVCKKAAMME